MPQVRLPKRKIGDVLRLHAAGPTIGATLAGQYQWRLVASVD
jgi:hypothetical protein